MIKKVGLLWAAPILRLKNTKMPYRLFQLQSKLKISMGKHGLLFNKFIIKDYKNFLL